LGSRGRFLSFAAIVIALLLKNLAIESLFVLLKFAPECGTSLLERRFDFLPFLFGEEDFTH
jgi:hypothetical protein